MGAFIKQFSGLCNQSLKATQSSLLLFLYNSVISGELPYVEESLSPALQIQVLIYAYGCDFDQFSMA